MNIRKVAILWLASLYLPIACQPEKVATRRDGPENEEAVINLVEEGVQFLQTHTVDEVCVDFTYNPRWREPDTKLFLIDERNRIWCIRDEPNLIWKILEHKATLLLGNIPYAMRERGVQGGWLSFLWNEQLVRVYVKNVTKGRRTFTMGAFLFSEGPRQQVKELVFTARNLLKQVGLNTAIERISSPTGQFLRGSFSVALYDYDGICLANSYNLTCVGSRAQDRIDDSGKQAFEKYVHVTKSAPYGWVDSVYNGIRERMFVARFTYPNAPAHRFYILTSGYYPQVNDEFVVSMTHEAKAVMEREGAEKAFAIFSPVTGHNPFYKARLYLVVYDEKGVIKAHSRFPSLVGVNAYYQKGQAGYFLTQRILNAVSKKDQGWAFIYIRNAAELVYVQRVTLPEGTFIVTIQGYSPLDKEHTSAAIVEWLCGRLTVEQPLLLFHSLNRGAAVWNLGFKGTGQANIYSDLFIEIYDKHDFCVSAGAQVHKMWKKMDDGFKHSLSKLKRASKPEGWFYDKVGGLTRRYYIKNCVLSSGDSYSIFVGYVWP